MKRNGQAGKMAVAAEADDLWMLKRDPPKIEWSDLSLLGGKYSHLRPRLPLVVLMGAIAAVFIYQLSGTLSDPAVTPVPTLADLVGDHPLAFGLLRLTFAAVVFLVLRALVFSSNVLRLTLTYFPGSSLVVTKPYIVGAARLSTFTVQNWTLIGLYFTGSGVMSVLAAAGVGVNTPSLLLGMWVVFQVCLANAMLVTTIVTFYLVPLHCEALKKEAEKTKQPIQSPIPFLNIIPTAMHNLNLFFMLSELLMNRLNVNMYHIPAASLWGIWYVLFSWWFMRNSGVVFYNFLDGTLPARKSMMFHIGLLLYLSLWFVVVYYVRIAADAMMDTMGVWTWIVVHAASIPLLKVNFKNMRLDYKNWGGWLIA